MFGSHPWNLLSTAFEKSSYLQLLAYFC